MSNKTKQNGKRKVRELTDEEKALMNIEVTIVTTNQGTVQGIKCSQQLPLSIMQAIIQEGLYIVTRDRMVQDISSTAEQVKEG